MFRDIKVGDKVIIGYAGINPNQNIYPVSKVTPKYFDAKGIRFRKSDGEPTGDFSNYYAKPYTEEKAAELQRQYKIRNNLSIVQNFRYWNRVSPEDVEKVISIICKYNQL